LIGVEGCSHVDRPLLERLRDRVAVAGYTETAIARLLDVPFWL